MTDRFQIPLYSPFRGLGLIFYLMLLLAQLDVMHVKL
jgi:hypothetical protein